MGVRAYSPVQTGHVAVGVSGFASVPCTALWPCELDEAIPAGGERWYAFYAEDNGNNAADATFGLGTQLGSLSDTTLTLFDASATTPLAYNDDVAPPQRHSELMYTVPRGSAGSRLRFARVAAYAPYQSGSFTFLFGGNDTPSDYACFETCEEAEVGLDNWMACIAEHCQ